MYVSVYNALSFISGSHFAISIHTSTVSRTLITPGWRIVRNLRRAFRANGSRDLFAVISKENMLHLEPSSYQVQVNSALEDYELVVVLALFRYARSRWTGRC